MLIKKIISVHEKLLLAKMQDLLDDPDFNKEVLVGRINEVFTSLDETLVELNRAELITELNDASAEILGSPEFDSGMNEAFKILENRIEDKKTLKDL